MKKLYCVICGMFIKFEKPKLSYLLEKTLVPSVICSKCKNEDQKIFKQEESIEILKIIGLIENIQVLWKYDWRKHYNLDWKIQMKQETIFSKDWWVKSTKTFVQR